MKEKIIKLSEYVSRIKRGHDRSSLVSYLLMCSIMLSMAACNPGKTQLGEEYAAGINISLANSALTVSNSQVASSNSVDVIFRLKDQFGSLYVSAKPVVTFSAVGGTSVGSFSSISHSNGIYTATFAGITPGTATTIHAQVDGQAITSTLPTVQVTTGNYSLSNSVISVSSGSVNSSSTITVTLTTKDASNTQLPDGGLTVLFSHSGGASTGTFSAVTDNLDGTYSATFTGVIAGAATDIHATIGGATVTSTSPTVTVSSGTSTSIAVSSGNLQTGTVGSAVGAAFVAVVKDANNNVVPSVTVIWAVTDGGGTLSSSSNSTNSSGLSSSTLTLGTTMGTNTVTATVNGTAINVSFSATGTAGVPASIAVSNGDGQGATVGSILALPLVAIVKDTYNNVINGAVVDWAVTAGGGSVGSCTPTTNSSGLAQCAFTIGTTAGPNTVTATVNGTAFTTSFGATGIAGTISLAQSTLTISSSSIVSNDTATLTITLKDTYGNQVANATQASNLAITILSAGTSTGTVGAIAAIDGNIGAYQATLTGITAGTANTIKASLSASDFTSTQPSFTVSVGAVTKLGFLQGPSSAVSNATISPSITVEALDVNNNRVTSYATDVVIAIDTNPSTGILSGTLTKTPASGVAIFNDLSINYYGTGYKLIAMSGSLTTVTSSAFNITATALTYDIPFTSVTTPVYTTLYTSSSWSLMEFIGNLVRIAPTVQIDDAATTGTMDIGTASGVVIGNLNDGLNSGLKLGNGGGCNGVSSDCAKKTAAEIYELNSSWAPQWPSIMSYWKMNDNWNDTKGTNTLTPSGANLSSTSKLGSHSGRFVGSSISATASPVTDILSGSHDYTISVWVNPGATQVVYANILDYGHCNLTNFTLQQDSANTNKFGIAYRKNDGAWATGITLDVIPSDQWSHLVIVKEGAVVKGYINGVLNKTGPTESTSVIAKSAQRLSVGGNLVTIGDCATRFFNGKVDELAIWNTPLNMADVQTIYDRQSGKHSGTFTSRIMDAKSTSSWTTLSWMPTLPFMKELPDAACAGATCTHVNNESSNSTTGYSSLVGSTGATGTDDLMNGIVGLWHLNEASGTTGAGSIKDDSGKGNHATPVSTTFGVSGKLNNGGSFNGTSSYLTGSITATDLSADFTISAWINHRSIIKDWSAIFSNNVGITSAPLLTMINNTNKIGINNAGVSATDISVDLGTDHFNKWIFVTVRRSGSTFYVDAWKDGVQISNSGAVYWTVTSGNQFYIGRHWTQDSQLFNGLIDEVAVWSRSLHNNEIKQLYQRGASRLKYQVRTCDDNTCSGESWQGPDGTNGTYFSELNNNTTPLTGAGDVKANMPSMLYSTFTSPPANNQYFQYRTIFESDSATEALMPELKSTTVDPIHYDASSPSIYGNNGIIFSELNAFVENLGSGGCSSGVGYNLSLDKATWKYWNGSAWVTANGTAAQSNIASIIQTNVSTFGTQVGKGTVYVKAYLKSSGTSKCELDNILLGGNR